LRYHGEEGFSRTVDVEHCAGAGTGNDRIQDWLSKPKALAQEGLADDRQHLGRQIWGSRPASGSAGRQDNKARFMPQSRLLNRELARDAMNAVGLTWVLVGRIEEEMTNLDVLFGRSEGIRLRSGTSHFS
jgi:hypothetical protein